MHPRVQSLWNRLARLPCGGTACVTPLPGAVQGRILAAGWHTPQGAFRRMLSQQVPQAIAWRETAEGRVYAYAAAMPCTDEYYAYLPDRLGVLQLGIVGVWVAEDYRRQGHARAVLRSLGELFLPVPPGKYVLSAEPRIANLARPLLPLHVLERWASQQASVREIKAAIRAREQFASGWWRAGLGWTESEQLAAAAPTIS